MYDEDWDDEAPVQTLPSTNSSGLSEGGCKFSKGRGFKPVPAFDGWEDTSAPGDWKPRSSSNKYSTNDYNDDWGEDANQRNNGFKSSHSHDDWENPNRGYGEDNRRGDGGHRRGRGGRGEGRGGRGGGGRGGSRGAEGGFGGGFASHNRNDDDPEKKPEQYIPVERIEENELFTTTIEAGINFMKLDEIDVKVSGENPPKPLTTWKESGLRTHLLKNVEKSGYKKPTPIQRYSIPVIMAGRDLMGCAQTGSGKTAAFLLPMINKLMEENEPAKVDGYCAYPKVVIVSPTRELTTQIYEQARKFAHDSIVRVVQAYGGTSVNFQKGKITAGCHILVATPGRLLDFVRKNNISFASMEFFVLDEADRMLDMGFLPSIEEMLSHSSTSATGERQTLMFSATFPEEVQELAAKFLHNYIFLAVGIVGSASTDVEQEFHQVTRFDKRNKLLEVLSASDPSARTLVFTETKRNADFIATFLSEQNIGTTSIHGDRLQKEREEALWTFTKGIKRVMVATSVAARGLDIKHVEHVVNYDLPKSIDEYVHRIGRTGRVGNKGRATSFFDPKSDGPLADALARILAQANQKVPAWLSRKDFAGVQASDFGGVDIRGDDYGHGGGAVADNVDDEVW